MHMLNLQTRNKGEWRNNLIEKWYDAHARIRTQTKYIQCLCKCLFVSDCEWFLFHFYIFEMIRDRLFSLTTLTRNVLMILTRRKILAHTDEYVYVRGAYFNKDMKRQMEIYICYEAVKYLCIHILKKGSVVCGFCKLTEKNNNT